LYGSAFTLLVALLMRENFEVQWTTKFIVSLAYLSIFGSVIAFGAYLSLVGRIGAEKAAYSSVLNPIIALILSSFFESFHWSLPVAIGIALCLIGNVITLWKPKKRATV
ncbi:MAG: EamA family transporter, partial [Proteobacteria bacterium]